MQVSALKCSLLLGIAVLLAATPSHAQPAAQAVSIFVVRHAESDSSQPTVPLTAAGRERAEQLTRTVQGIRFTHLFASHTQRSREMLDAIAASRGLKVVQLPEPGSTFDGKPVTDQTTRRAPIEPISKALLELPAGSVALVALNSENIFAILNRLGLSVAEAGKACELGSRCVPCTDNSCYPRNDYDHLWHLVLAPGRAEPIAFAELRYAVGWKPSAPK